MVPRLVLSRIRQAEPPMPDTIREIVISYQLVFKCLLIIILSVGIAAEIIAFSPSGYTDIETVAGTAFSDSEREC